MHQSSNSKDHPKYSSPILVDIPEANTSLKTLTFAGVVLVTSLGMLLVISHTWKPQKIDRTPVVATTEKPLDHSTEEDDIKIVTGQEINDQMVLERLNQKLYENLDKSWKIPVTETSIYRVRVDQMGEIVSYQPQNTAASENLNNTPLPSLTQVNSPASGDNPSRDFAEFEVIFNQTGKLDVYPKN